MAESRPSSSHPTIFGRQIFCTIKVWGRLVKFPTPTGTFSMFNKDTPDQSVFEEFETKFESNVEVSYDGSCSWLPPAILYSSCEVFSPKI